MLTSSARRIARRHAVATACGTTLRLSTLLEPAGVDAPDWMQGDGDVDPPGHVAASLQPGECTA